VQSATVATTIASVLNMQTCEQAFSYSGQVQLSGIHYLQTFVLNRTLDTSKLNCVHEKTITLDNVR